MGMKADQKSSVFFNRNIFFPGGRACEERQKRCRCSNVTKVRALSKLGRCKDEAVMNTIPLLA